MLLESKQDPHALIKNVHFGFDNCFIAMVEPFLPAPSLHLY